MRQVYKSLFHEIVVARAPEHPQARATAVLRRVQPSVHSSGLFDEAHKIETSRITGRRDERGREETFADTVVQHRLDRGGENENRRVEEAVDRRIVKNYFRPFKNLNRRGNSAVVRLAGSPDSGHTGSCNQEMRPRAVVAGQQFTFHRKIKGKRKTPLYRRYRGRHGEIATDDEDCRRRYFTRPGTLERIPDRSFGIVGNLSIFSLKYQLFPAFFFKKCLKSFIGQLKYMNVHTK